MGPVERAVRRDITSLGELIEGEQTLSELAYRVAQQIDKDGDEESKQLSALSRELRLVLATLLDGHATGGNDAFGDLGSPE